MKFSLVVVVVIIVWSSFFGKCSPASKSGCWCAVAAAYVDDAVQCWFKEPMDKRMQDVDAFVLLKHLVCYQRTESLRSYRSGRKR